MSFDGLMDTYSVSKYICSKLAGENFTIHFHESIQSNSAHIKLDYGLQNTIRISDTPGPKHYGYKFNVVVGLRQSHYIDFDGHKRYYYSVEDMDEMLDNIVKQRNSRVYYAGEEGLLIQVLVFVICLSFD